MTRFTRTAPPPTANDPPTPKPPRPLAFATAPRSAGDADDASSASGGTRFERKYLLREAEADVVSRFLAARLTADGHTSNARYTVRSLYFDTPDFADYRAKLDGDPVRRKFRLQTYGDAPGAPVRLERKSRAGQVYRKERTWLGDADLARLRDRSGPGPGTPGVLGQLLYAAERWAYAPVVLVVYERQAYCEVPGDDIVRVTLDRRLRARVPGHRRPVRDRRARAGPRACRDPRGEIQRRGAAHAPCAHRSLSADAPGVQQVRQRRRRGHRWSAVARAEVEPWTRSSRRYWTLTPR